MVFCIILGCGNRSERNTGTYSSIPIPYSNMKANLSESELKNVVVRRRLWLKAIARDDLTETKLKYERVCFRHFVNGTYAIISAGQSDGNSITSARCTESKSTVRAQ